MISFEQAIEIATTNASSLIEKSKNLSLEGILISEDGKLYEVSLSYDIEGENPASISKNTNEPVGHGLSQLIKVMSYRRQYKTFLVDAKNGEFRGFIKSKMS
ncbi:MAG: hypothetical protein WA154_04150 [Moraxellaceae bacterium]